MPRPSTAAAPPAPTRRAGRRRAVTPQGSTRQRRRRASRAGNAANTPLALEDVAVDLAAEFENRFTDAT